MIDFASLPMALKTTLTTLLFLTLCAGVYAALVIGGKQGKGKLCLMTALTLTVGAMMLLYASLIPAERAKPEIPAVSLWFARQPVVFTTLVWLASPPSWRW